MTLTIQLPPDLEARLLRQAASAGMDAGEFVVSTLASRLEQPKRPHAASSDAEAELLLAINQGLSEEMWQRYRALDSRRQAETLSTEEQAELAQLSDRIEEDHACRMERMAQLAALRGTSLPALMEQMGIHPPHV